MSVTTTELVDNLHKNVLEIEKIYKTMKQIQLREKDDIHNVFELQKLLEDVKTQSLLLLLKPELKKLVEDWILEYTFKINNDIQLLKRRFGDELNSLLQIKGISLSGTYPDLVAEMFTIEVNFQIGFANIWYGPKQELLGRCKTVAPQVAGALDKIRNSIISRPFDEKVFINRLYQAYLRALHKGGALDDQAEIISVLDELVFLQQDNRFLANPAKENFKEYTRAFFSYDLFRLKDRRFENKLLTISTAARLQTKNRSGFLWLPTNTAGVGSYYGFISFREDKHGLNA